MTLSPRPEPSDEKLHVWQFRLDVAEDDLLELDRLLSADERERAARFHFERDRNRYIAGRGMLRRILAEYLGRRAPELAFIYGLCGKPALAGSPCEFNLSHSDGLALLASAPRGAVGVDVERIRPIPDWDGVTNAFFSAAERDAIAALPSEDRLSAFFHCWTRKETYLKATGDGIGVRLDQFVVPVAPGSHPRLLHVEGASAECERWVFHQIPVEPGFVGVAASESPRDVVHHVL